MSVNKTSGSNTIRDPNTGTKAEVKTFSGEDRLLVDARSNLVVDPSDNPGCPTLSKKLRFDFSDSDLILTASYQTAYTYSGSGKLVGFIFDFDRDGIDIKLTIDSDVIFDINSSDLNDILTMNNKGGSAIGGLGYDNSAFKIIFDPECPIAYDTLVKVEAKKDALPTGTLNRYIVNLTKET